VEITNSKIGIMAREALADPEKFWASAGEALPWRRGWDAVFDWDPERPDERGRYFRWYSGGLTNLAWNAVDRHVERGRGGVAALVCENERGGRQVLTYGQLQEQVSLAAAALRGLGVARGDRVGIYMPTCAESVIVMLACARIGAIHLVVFAGFGAGALGERLRLSGATAVFCADITWRKGNDVSLKPIVDEAVADCASVRHVVVLRRGDADPEMRPGRDIFWEEFLAGAAGHSGEVGWLESNEPVFILATSGTTARPKLAVHTHGGYQVYVHAMGDWVFGLREDDVWWSTSDIGWVVGHSYIVYAPLLAGATTIAYEGALDHPGPQTFYRITADNRVTGIFTSPTAVRLLMKYGTGPASEHELGSLTRVVCAGEVLNPPAWQWLAHEVLGGRVPVIDHMWQTETGGPIIGNPFGLGLLPVKPGSSGVPLPGIDVAVLDADGQPCAPGEKGIMVIRRPFPGLTATLWGEPGRYASDYWQRIPGQDVYFSGDAAEFDSDGYVWFSGRADEIIKIAGHRLGTIEVESAFLHHPAVAEAGVTGRPDPVRMEVISAFIALKSGYQPSDSLSQELRDVVRHELGPVAVIGEINFVSSLPKTRSGKIMRRVLRAVTLGRDPGDISTIEDEGSVSEARQAWEAMRRELSHPIEAGSDAPDRPS
jgi:acetyl-CoA synthetase